MGNVYEAHLRIEATPVFRAILEGERTFMDLAVKYGVNIKVFERVLREKVGDKEFERLQKVSKQNWQNRLRKHANPKIAEQQVEPKKAISSREQIIQQRDDIAGKIENLKKEVGEEEAKLATADAKVAEAEALLMSAKEERMAVRRKLSGKRKKLTKKEGQYNALEEKLREMDNKVYLVAPGYNGELPGTGKMISVIPFDGAELQEGYGLLKEPTFVELLESGYELITEAKNAYNFARLVTKYQIEGIEATILVDDDRIMRILKDQGLDV